MFHTHPVRLAQFCRRVRGPSGRGVGGVIGVDWSPPLLRTGKRRSLSQPSVPDAFPPSPARNDPFQHSKGGDIRFLLAGPPELLRNMRFTHPATTLARFDPLAAPLQGSVSDSARVLSFILPLKYDDMSVYRRCLLSGSVGWTCLSAATPPLAKNKTMVSLCSAPGHNDPLGTCLLVWRVTTQLKRQI